MIIPAFANTVEIDISTVDDGFEDSNENVQMDFTDPVGFEIIPSTISIEIVDSQAYYPPETGFAGRIRADRSVTYDGSNFVSQWSTFSSWLEFCQKQCF